MGKLEKEKLDSILEFLLSIRLSELTGLFLKLFDSVAGKKSPKEILDQYKSGKFFSVCNVPQKTLTEMDLVLFEQLPGDFSTIEFSPVGPVGAKSVLTNVSQRNVVATIRNSEVLSDPSTMLALQTANMRSRLSKTNTHLATSARCLRGQDFSKIPGFTQHFRAFAISSAGRNKGGLNFEVECLKVHIDFFLRSLKELSSKGLFCRNIVVKISDISLTDDLISRHSLSREFLGRNTQNSAFSLFDTLGLQIPKISEGVTAEISRELGIENQDVILRRLSACENKVIPWLRERHPDVVFCFDLERIAGIGNYQDLAYKISAENINGELFPLVDGGFSNWTQKLLNNGKERLLTSGFGSELYANKFLVNAE